MTKPTDEQIAEIQASDESNAVLGKRLGLHHMTVKKVRKEHAQSAGDTFTADSPKKPKNEASEAKTAPHCVPPRPQPIIRMAKDWPTTIYTDGPDNIVQTIACRDGVIPAGWHDDAADCVNFIGNDTTRFEAFD